MDIFTNKNLIMVLVLMAIVIFALAYVSWKEDLSFRTTCWRVCAGVLGLADKDDETLPRDPKQTR